MERRMFEAALAGDVDELHRLVHENPLILLDYALISPHENPLHVATKAGKLHFVQEIIRLKAEFAREQNQEGFRPLDIASSFGYVDILNEIINSSSIQNDICRLKGRDGRTAIHYAAMNGKLEVMDELLSSSKECIEDVTVLGETALHLAVKYHRFEALKTLVEWLKKLSLEEMVNWRDNDGNSVLHLAVSRKQYECVEFLLLMSTLKLNETNSRGLTAMDIMDLPIENPSDVRIRELLRLAGALGARDITNATASSTPAANSPPQIAVNAVHSNLPPAEKTDWIKYFRFQQKRDSPSDIRNVLLVVTVLIATVTFQAGVNPPSSFLRKDTESVNSTTSSDAAPSTGPVPDLHRRTTQELVVSYIQNLKSVTFLFFNSMGLAASISVMTYLTAGLPFQAEVFICFYSFGLAYGFAVSELFGPQSISILGVATLVPQSVRWLPILVRKLRKQTRNSR